MKKLIWLLLVIAQVVVGANAQAPKSRSWREYIMRDEKLKVSLPRQPSVTNTTEKRNKSEAARARTILDASADGVTYTINVFENRDPRQSLAEFIEAQTKFDSKLDASSERELTVEGSSGKAFNYRNGKGMVQFFATENHLYEFRAQGAPVDDAKLTKFFSSLSFKIPPGIGPSLPADATGAVDKTYAARDLDTKAKLKSKPEPSYTAAAERDQINGTVILRCIFRSDGTVTNIEVIQGLPGGLTQKAIEAAKKIKFVPATKDGKPVSMWMQLEYNFSLFR